MKWFFQDRPAGNQAGQQDESDSPAGLISLPEALLERHGARVLDPAKASAVTGYPAPRPTVYRARALLVPGHLLLPTSDFITHANEALVHVGMEFSTEQTSSEPDPDEDDGDKGLPREILQALQEVPRPAVLVPAKNRRTPVVIDAWEALQALRAAADSPDHPYLDKSTVMQVGLEHLAIGSGITGSPVGNGGGGVSGGSGGGDPSAPTITSSYLFQGGDARMPVAVLFEPPAYEPDAQPESGSGRRAVVAVLDTGLRKHDWLGVDRDATGEITTSGAVKDDPKIQAAIYKEGKRARDRGDKPRRLIEDAWDDPMGSPHLVGELNDALGHGTFIAGIVRQVAPDARVLAVRVMGSDDVAYEGDILCALRHLAKRIALNADGDMAAMTKVASLSFGYFSESPAYAAETSGLWGVIRLLLSLGVVVVAAAGNYATGRKFYPAAFAVQTVPEGQVPVISVGALNPNATKAMFSDDGSWVWAFTYGAAVVSTFPQDVNASRCPELAMPAPAGVSPPGREALDPDDFTCGWAIWSGTSFAAPYMAALIARSLPGVSAVTAVENLQAQQGQQGG